MRLKKMVNLYLLAYWKSKKMIRIFKGLKANYFNLFKENKGCFKRLYNAATDVLCFILSFMLLTTLTPLLFVIYFFRVWRKKKYERNIL